MRIRQMPVKDARDAGRSKRAFQTANASARNRQRNKNVGVADGVMIEEVLGAGLECIYVNGPAADRSRQSNLELLIALAVQRQESQALSLSELQQRAANRRKRRRLIVAAIEAAQYPAQLAQA